jgi:hypothetical protein
MLGEIGRLYDVVFIETTQVNKLAAGTNIATNSSFAYSQSVGALADQTSYTGSNKPKVNSGPGLGGNPENPSAVATTGTVPGSATSPATTSDVYESIMIGDNAFGHAISLPVELRDGGVLDFGREHALAWYAIWGLGVITDQAIVKVYTN